MVVHEATATEDQYPLPPSTLDGKHYTDPQQYARELETIFFRSWMPVVPAADLPEPRDVVVWEQLHQSVVISRLDDGGVAAWHNVCQHRGAKIVRDSGRCPTGRFTCPWHGLTYNLKGEVTGVPMVEIFDPAELDGLRARSVRAVQWAGWIWLCFSDDVPELEPYLGDIYGELGGYGLESFTTQYRTSLLLQANWKVVIDAFNETWHVPFTHQHTLAGLVLWRDAALKITPPHSWMTLPVRGLAERTDSDDHRKKHICHYLAFPNTIFSCFPTHLQTWNVWPISVDETLLTAYGMVGPTPAGMSEEKWARNSDRDWNSFMDVLAEDVEVIKEAGEAMHSLGFRRNMFNIAEGRLTAFHEEVNARAG